ncbi:hypothetical protein [Muriventricola aceti]|uniref:hypothetical protein n=1 Tax=Muriventricola aceti TaxID=2981773 RepID=UPI000821531C|nr:hypothetical protein [Muriventricola aceti]MCU6702442.1 hypothetical protein [Muriventricola aceti]SCJ03863.1 Uncharacterised protein [uncultured Flavonifractor sp.]
MSNEVRNTSAIAEFEDKTPAPRRVGAELAASREAQEVQVAMVAAKRFPRDEVEAYNRILRDCQRTSLAEKAMYEFPRGGQVVTGPSVHLAKTLARGWGNIDSGFKVLEQTAKESTVMAYCWDLETNYRETKVFTVPHIRETKKGAYPLTDPRDIYEMVANQAARRERSCILSVIPGDVVDAAVGQCNATLAGKSRMPLVDMVRALVKNFQEQYGVTAEMLETYIGCKKEAFSQQSVVRLKNVYNTLRDGSANVEQYFDMSQVSPADEKPEESQDTPQNAAPSEEQVSLNDL